ncbi:MAG: Phosphoheptose isomerase [Chlamydiales bacterium]|nr:Phosphoheptose isomerase [Chlamydiales bacterium]MCH9619242.1 Phosphoheptose isomerase [Chlamydiales bacterium]MCH9622504.1 Phosphoheptose isomerase [Chlamydiales bacterium]
MIRKKILQAVDEGVTAVASLKEQVPFIETSAKMIASCFTQGGKLIIAGNGGSLCDAAHFAEELTGFFRKKRRALPAIVLNEPGHLTCVGNDAGFDEVFSRGVEAYGKEGDLFIGLTTSGKSMNLIRAFERARELNLKTVAFLGKGGGKLKGVADVELLIEGFETSDRIQEAHMTAIHIIIEMVEAHLFDESIVAEMIGAI